MEKITEEELGNDLTEGERKELGLEKKAEKKNEIHRSCCKTEDCLLEEIYSPDFDPPFQFVYLPQSNDSTPVFCEKYEDKVSKKVIYPLIDENVEKGVVLLPNTTKEYKEDKNLISEIQGFIHKYIDIEPFFEKLCSYYVLFTWVYDCFDVVPYLRVIGDTGTGKTRFLKTIGSICYKPIFCGGAITPAPIYRFIEIYHGTLIIDESDFRFSDGFQEIIKILNCGYTKGIPVLRCEGEKGKFSPKAYDCFSPKVIANRNRFNDLALESRCITYQMKGRERQDISLNLPPEFEEEALTIKNKLLLWRLKNYGKRKVDTNLLVENIEDRVNQIFLPLLSVIDDENVRSSMEKFIWDYNQELIKERGMTLEAEVVEVIVEMIGEGNTEPSIKEIAERYNNKYEVSEKSKIKPRKVGNIVRKMGIETKRGSDGYYHICNDTEKVEKLKRKYYLIPIPPIPPFKVRKSEKNTKTLECQGI